MNKTMYSHFFKPGMDITISDKEATIIHPTHEVILVRFKETGVYLPIDRHQAAQMYTDGDLEIKRLEIMIPAKQVLTLEEQEETNRKVEYVKYILSQKDPLSKKSLQGLPAVAARLGDRKPPSKSTLGRWKEKYLQGGQHFMSLAPLKPGPKQIRTAAHFVDDIQEALDERFLVKNPATFLDIYNDLVMKWKAKGYKAKGKGSYPSETTFYDLKDHLLFDEDIIDGQLGKAAAKKAKRMALKKYITHHILERVEIDSMYISDGLVDDEFRYLGPIMLTAAIDVHSRVILGISLEVGRKGESTEHIVDCIRNATLPKQGNKSIPEQYRNEWPMYGKPSQIIADAGSGYTSESFTRLLALLDISRDTTKVRQPWKKPHIERFFGTMRKSFLQQLPGYISASRYANDLESDETLEKSATLTVSQFKEQLYHYILKDYHHKPHHGLNGETPFEVWQKGAGFTGMSPPEGAHLIRMTYPRVENVTLDPVKGVQYQYLKYHSDKLRQLYRNMKKPSDRKHPKIDIYISHSDMSHVVVSDPFNDEFLLVPCTNKLVCEGMSLGETKYINGTISPGKHYEPTNYQERTKQFSDDKKARDKKAKQDRKKRPVNPPVGVENAQAEINELLDAGNMNVYRDAFEDVQDSNWDNEE